MDAKEQAAWVERVKQEYLAAHGYSCEIVSDPKDSEEEMARDMFFDGVKAAISVMERELEKAREALKVCKDFALQGIHEPDSRGYCKAIRDKCQEALSAPSEQLLKVKCRHCGSMAAVPEERREALEKGYAVTLYCPNQKCPNATGGLFSKPTPSVAPEKGRDA